MYIGGVIVCLFVASLLFFFSYLIGKKKGLTFIAGYNEETFKGDKDQLAKAAGIFLLVLGLLILIFPAAFYAFGNLAGNVLFVIVIVSTVVLIWYMRRLNRSVV